MLKKPLISSAAAFVVASILVGCTTPGGAVPELVVQTDYDCSLSRSLQRDLSVAAVYKGVDQVYLTGEGRLCSFK